MTKFCGVWLLIFYAVIGFGQTSASPTNKAKIDAINKYVDFVNESIHGMFLVNRLLVEYNMELNKYVDLENEKINNYSNKDLPADIFEDKEHWFYEIPPYELLNQAKQLSVNLDPKDKSALDNYTQKLLAIIKSSNQLRFDVEKASTGVDLTKKENIDIVYKKLEEGVKYFEDFYKIQLELEKVIEECKTKYVESNTSFKSFYDGMNRSYKTSKLVLTKIRTKDADLLDQIMLQFNENLAAYKLLKPETLSSNKAASIKIKFAYENGLKSLEEMKTISNAFLQNELIPNKYKLYGRFYYYYNVELISKFNKYGSGLAFQLNDMIHLANLPLIKFTELPHIFQVIYPKKIVKTDVIKATDEVVSLPQVVKERKVNKNKVMKVDSDVVEIELYDHMIIDGDVVSINFNGDWILEKAELEKGSKMVKLKLNVEGKNYLLLHADNIGKRPPNTMALSYKFRGEKLEIVLKSDLNASEMIEIIQVKK
jgi:hypothetical protein